MAQPKTVTTPTVTPKLDEPKMGFSTYAERLNGRAAMMGFVIALAIEYVTHNGALTWLGLVNP
jgi:Chlorophyll A-B binding protein